MDFTGSVTRARLLKVKSTRERKLISAFCNSATTLLEYVVK